MHRAWEQPAQWPQTDCQQWLLLAAFARPVTLVPAPGRLSAPGLPPAPEWRPAPGWLPALGRLLLGQRPHPAVSAEGQLRTESVRNNDKGLMLHILSPSHSSYSCCRVHSRILITGPASVASKSFRLQGGSSLGQRRFEDRHSYCLSRRSGYKLFRISRFNGAEALSLMELERIICQQIWDKHYGHSS